MKVATSSTLGLWSVTFFPFLPGVLQILVAQYPYVRIGRIVVARRKSQALHIRRGLIAPVVRELLGVVASCLLYILCAGRDVVHQVQGQAVRFLIVATCRNFTLGPVYDDTSIEQAHLRRLVGRIAVVNDRLD